MSLASASMIAESALAFEMTRMAVSAANVANLSTEAYSASRVDGQPRADGGVTCTIRSTGQPTDLVEETVTQMTAVVSYRADLTVIRTADQMSGALLDVFV